MANIACVGKHFVNVEEISHIEPSEVGSKDVVLEYAIIMRNGKSCYVKRVDFDKFIKKNLSYLKEGGRT